MELRIRLSEFEFDGLNMAVPMKSKASLALARAVPLTNTDFLIECDESEARDMLKHVGRYPSAARRILDALREANISVDTRSD